MRRVSRDPKVPQIMGILFPRTPTNDPFVERQSCEKMSQSCLVKLLRFRSHLEPILHHVPGGHLELVWGGNLAKLEARALFQLCLLLIQIEWGFIYKWT